MKGPEIFMKKVIAIMMSVVMLISLPLSASAKSVNTDTDIGTFATRIAAELSNINALSGISKIAANLLQNLTERLQNTEIKFNDLSTVIDEYSKVIMNVYEGTNNYIGNMLNTAYTGEGGTAPVSTDETNESGSGSFITLRDIIDMLSRYLFIRVDNAEEVAELIASTCNFTYVVLQDGNGTIYIRVDIENNPEIFNYAVFYNLVKNLYAMQGEEMIKRGDGTTDYLMSYQHIAGELALHAILYAAATEVIRLTGISNETLLNMYHSVAQADLNIDETRVPTQLMVLFGKIIMSEITYNIMRIFRLI